MASRWSWPVFGDPFIEAWALSPFRDIWGGARNDDATSSKRYNRRPWGIQRPTIRRVVGRITSSTSLAPPTTCAGNGERGHRLTNSLTMGPPFASSRVDSTLHGPEQAARHC